MLKRILAVATLIAIASLTAVASDREDDVNRTQKAAQVFKEIMNTPDQGIPSNLLESAKCIAIIPGDKKFAFVFGGSYGRGIATCRTEHGWSAPMFVAIDGGSVGYQIGGSSTDLVMLFMNDHALQSLMSDKFKLGATTRTGGHRSPEIGRARSGQMVLGPDLPHPAPHSGVRAAMR